MDSITIPDGITSLKDSVLSTVTSISLIGTGLEEMDFHATAAQATTNAISGILSLKKLIVRGVSRSTWSFFQFGSNSVMDEIYFYATTAPTINKLSETPAKNNGTLYVPANSTGYDQGTWKTMFIDNGWTLSKTL